MRIAYLGPPGTFSEEALRASLAGREAQLDPQPTVHDAVMAVHEGRAERALVPIENSLEGSVTATLDALTGEACGVAIVGETTLPIRHCLIARSQLALDAIESIVSHPQATAQCAAFIRERLPGARVVQAGSTAEAVRAVAESREPWAALGSRAAAELYDCHVLEDGVEDGDQNVTRFIWLAADGTAADEPIEGAPWKTSIVFWGEGDESPGWLVRCLSELAFRGVNLSRIESRPRRKRLGHYLFFADLEGSSAEQPVAAAIEGLRTHCEDVRLLGSYAAAT